MSLIAVIFALICERGVTHLLHLRELRWLDPIFDHADRALGGRTGLAAIATAVFLLAMLTVPVAIASQMLGPQLLRPAAVRLRGRRAAAFVRSARSEGRGG